jgi:probable O-glycosylation ligase (exosortase A-associated)
MGIRDLVLFLVIFGSLPICIARPYIGVVVWSWLGYMNPHRLTWGVAWGFPFSQLVAATTLAGLALLIIRERKPPKLPWVRETFLLLLLLVMFTLTTFFALRPELAWPQWERISKILLMTFITSMLVDDERKLRYLLLVIALSLGFYGLKGGVFSILAKGKSMVFGPEHSFIEDNTALGLALNMVLPILFYLAKGESNRWLKYLLQVTFGMTMLAVLFTYSRGAFLGLVVVLGLLLLRARFRMKLVAAIALVVLLPIAVNQIPDRWIDRMRTIENYEEDRSAMSRIEAWKASWQLALHRPLVGGGFNALHDPDTYLRYNPDIPWTRGGKPDTQGAHSIYFEVLGENGFITFAIFVLLLFFAIMRARKVRRVSEENELPIFCYYGHMLEISFVAYAVSGAFLERASFDLFYHLVAVVIVVKILLKKKLQHIPRDFKEPVVIVDRSPNHS